MDQDIITTKRFFKSHHIALSDYWLESCIQWYREEHPNSNHNLETLHLKVYEQWLLLDLRDVEVPILPPNLAEQKKVVLNGIFSLQLLHVMDISRPKLWQIQKLRSSSALSNATADQEYQPNNSSKRMLQLLLTDGVNEIEAIEYQPVNVLNANLAPGIKIKITGPVTVRRGQILLEEKHVTILGGEVEELLVENAAENVLARVLNMPMNPNPHIVEESFATANVDILQNSRNGCNRVNIAPSANDAQTVATNVVSNRIHQQPSVAIINNQLPRKIDDNIPKRENLVDAKKANSNFITEEEEMRIMAEVDMLLEAERDIMQERRSGKIDSSLRFEAPCVNTDAPILKIKNIESLINSKGESSSACDIKENTSSESIFEDMDIDAHLDLIDEEVECRQSNAKGVVAISNLLKNRNNITNGRFTIKAKFKSVVQKLTVTDDAWSLKLLVTDETGDLEAYMHSDIISNIMGFCPSAMMALKKGIINKDECATATIMKTIEELKQKIMELDCLMEVTFRPDETYPTIVNLK